MDTTFSETLQTRLRAGARTLVLTGAGVSAESGLATFRGPGGMWEGRNPIELASPAAFRDDPMTVWRFYRWRREQAAAAEPNAGHSALVALEGRLGDAFELVTQNVDGLHERAGSRRVTRLHGSLWRLRCIEECKEFDDSRVEFDPFPPVCDCGAMLRPGVVWFGEALPADALQHAEVSARRAELVLVVGTSGMVHPAAGLPSVARASGAWVVEINPETTPLTAGADEHLSGTSGAILPLVADAAGGEIP